MVHVPVEFEKGEDPHLCVTGKYNAISAAAHLALSPNGEVVAIATGATLSLYSALSGVCDKVIDNVYSNGKSTGVNSDTCEVPNIWDGKYSELCYLPHDLHVELPDLSSKAI